MARTQLHTIVHLEHVDPTEYPTHSDPLKDPGDPQTFYASTGGYDGLAPDDTQYVPCVDADSLELNEVGMDGRTVQTIRPAGPQTIRLKKHTHGQARLAPLEGRRIIGREATAAWVGTDADNVARTTANPIYLAKGRVVAPIDEDNEYFEFTIKPHDRFAKRVVPSKAFLGYRSGVLGNGDGAATSVITVSGYTAMPSAVTLMALVLVPRLWDVGASDTQCIWATKALHFGSKLAADGYSWQLFARYSIDASGTLEEILGPTITPDETVKMLSLRFTTSTKVARFGVDASYTEDTGVSAYVAPSTEAWQMLRFRSDATSVTSTLMGAWMLFSAALTDAKVTELVFTRATGEETDLELFFPETDGAGVLEDHTIANAANPKNGTITSATETSLFEGPEDLAGSVSPLIFQGQHMRPVPVDHSRLIYRMSKEPIHHISQVMDGGNPFAMLPRYGVRDLLTGTAPASGEVAVTADNGGLMLFHSLRDGAELAADVQGCSLWKESILTGTDHNTAYVTFPTAMNPGGNDFAFDLVYSFKHDAKILPLSAPKIVFSSDFLEITQIVETIATEKKAVSFLVLIQTTGGGGVQLITDRLPQLGTYHFHVQAHNSGPGAAVGRLMINGSIADSGVNVGGVLQTSFSQVPRLSDPTDNFEHLAVFPMMLWGPGVVADNDADAETAARRFMSDEPDALDAEWSDLLHLYTGKDGNTATVPDQKGSQDGTVVNPGSYGKSAPGLCAGDPVSATAYLMREKGALDLDTDVTFEEDAYAIEPAAQSLWFDSETSLAEAVSQAIGPGYVLLGADGTATVGRMPIPSASTSQGTLYALEVGPKGLGGGDGNGLPPSVIKGEWGRIGAPGQTVLASATSARASLMSKEVRIDEVSVGDNAAIHNDDAYPQGVYLVARTKYRDRAPTRRELERLATAWTDPRPLYEVLLEGSGRDVKPLTAWKVIDPRDDSEEYVLLVSRKLLPDREIWLVR